MKTAIGLQYRGWTQLTGVVPGAMPVKTPLGRGLHVLLVGTGAQPDVSQLAVGEERVVGLYLCGGVTFLQVVRRETGLSMPAQSGDLYTILAIRADGQVQFSHVGRLEILDSRQGVGLLRAAIDSSPLVSWGVISLPKDA